jgi:Nif-specific regulatory protein
MDAELVVLGGLRAGSRIPLDRDEISIGKAPSNTLVLTDANVAWRHCLLRGENGRYLITDLRSGAGTYINGLRTAEQWLENGDQIAIGDTMLLFHVPGDVSVDTAGDSLMRASALLYLIRALASAQGQPHYHLLESQTLQLIGEFVPCTGGTVLLGDTEPGVLGAARERSSNLEPLVARMCREGIVSDGSRTGVPLYVRGTLAGALILEPGEAAAPAGQEREHVLSAVATLCSIALESIYQIENLRRENQLLQEQLGAAENTGMLGRSPAILKLHQMVDRVASLDTTVLILGESGTGKELVARALHQKSPRRQRPFVAINCAALTESLLESELFGHEKGAFTGAVSQKRGKLELAEGGTIFLDEIGELAPPLQAKLLRVLQQREFERVGGTQTIQLSVRLIAATNRDLLAETRRGAFREDLYHRLNVVSLRTPTLRERRDDILILASRFLARVSAKCGRRVKGFSPEAERLLLEYRWPGNVRELENAVERAVVLGEAEYVMPEDLPETLIEAIPPVDLPSPYQATLGDAKRASILRAWQDAKGDYKDAARLLGIHPNSLLRLIRNFGLRDTLQRPSAAGQ